MEGMRRILRDVYGAHPRLVDLLLENGLISPPVVEATLNPSLLYLVPPDTLPDIKPAAELLLRHLKRGRRILIWGHEDADGFTSTAVMLRTLEVMGAAPGQVDYIIPSKKKDGHGLSRTLLEPLKGQVDLIVTVDCGTSNVREVAFARELGIEVIVTDHHEPPEVLPETYVINPKIGGENYPYLAGVGVAFKFAWYLLRLDQKLGLEQIVQNLPELFIFTAVGTLADRVPLVSENQILVQTGSELFHTRSLPFVRALQRKLEGGDLNALVSPVSSGFSEENRKSLAVSFLLAREDDEANRILNILWERMESWNRRAQEALEMALSQLGRVRRYVYVDLPDVEPHYLGFVASRLKDQFGLPTIVTGRKGPAEVVGEVRYPPGEDSLELLRELSHLFLSWGGHKLASGFSMEARDLPELIEELEWFFSQDVGNPPTLPVDLELAEMDRELLRDVVRWARHNIQIFLRIQNTTPEALQQLSFEGIPVVDPIGLLRLYPPETPVEVTLRGGPEGLTLLALVPLSGENKEVLRGYSGRSTTV